MSGRTREFRFHEAVRVNNLQAVESLLKQGVNPSSINDRGWTSLHHACYDGNIKLARLLLSFRADPNITDAEGRTPLHVGAGNAEIVGMLIDGGADISKRDKAGRTGLHVAVDHAADEAMRRLFKRGADPDDAATDGTTAVHRAVDTGNLGAIGVVLSAKPKHVDARDKEGLTALLIAAKRLNLEAVDALLSAGANPNLGHDPRIRTIGGVYRGDTPLHIAASSNDPAMMRRLLECPGIDIDPVDGSEYGQGRTPLRQAVERGSGKCAALLIDAGANLDLVDSKSRTALHRAMELQDRKIATALLQAGANPDIEAADHKTARDLDPSLVLRHSTRIPGKGVVARAAFELVRDTPAAVSILGDEREKDRCIALATHVAQQSPGDADSKRVIENIRKIRTPEPTERRHDMANEPTAAPAFRR